MIPLLEISHLLLSLNADVEVTHSNELLVVNEFRRKFHPGLYQKDDSLYIYDINTTASSSASGVMFPLN